MVSGKRCYKQIHVFHSEHCRTGKYQASCVILAHNHPGGSASPSEEDCYVTKQVYTGLQYLNVALEDHSIIGKNAVISMREHGFWETLL